MGRLKGKVALITGTAQGTGRAAALAFAAEGAQVIGCDLKTTEAEETVALVRCNGGRMSSYHPLDIGDREQARRWVADAWEERGAPTKLRLWPFIWPRTNRPLPPARTF